MHEKIRMRLTGVTPLLMSNARTADPLNEHAQRLKKLTSKRKKTDADHEAVSRVEWEGRLYWDPKIGPYVPGENIDATLKEAAKSERRGKDVTRGVVCVEKCVPIKIEGDTDLDSLWDEGYFDRRTVVNQRNRVARTRPCFDEWELECTVAYNPKVINKADLLRIAEYAGEMVGLCDYRPRYGRFDVEEIEAN